MTYRDKRPIHFNCSARASGETRAHSVVPEARESQPVRDILQNVINYFYSHTSVWMCFRSCFEKRSLGQNICSDTKVIRLGIRYEERASRPLSKKRTGRFWVQWSCSLEPSWLRWNRHAWAKVVITSILNGEMKANGLF